MKNNYQLLNKKIEEYKNIIIAKHVFPDWDAQGSAFGLKEIILENFQNKNVLIVGEDLENPGKFFNEKLSDEIIKDSILITVDTANYERVDFDKKNIVKEIFKIDHHLNNDKYAANEIVFESASSCTEVITLWAQWSNFKINKEASLFLYKGLITDSGRFLYKSTSVETFKAAQILLESGISITDIYDSLYLKTWEEAKEYNAFFNKIQTNKKGNISYIVLSEKEISEINEENVKSALSTMSGIKEFKIWLLAHQREDYYKISIRSRDYDINSVAKKFDGGGHLLASGCKIKDIKMLQDVILELEKLLGE